MSDQGKTGGHLFVIDGDLRKITCDAVLIPTSNEFRVSTGKWRQLLVDGFRGPTDEERTDGWRLIRDPGATAPHVWFANTDSCTSDPRSYAKLAADFVRQSHKALGARADHPRLALNLLGAGRGGMSHRRGELIDALVRELTAASVETGSDVILTAFGPEQYSAVQHVRRRSANATPAMAAGNAESIAERIEELAERSRLGRLVVFIGAGVSRGAGLPGWQELLDLMAQEITGEEIDIARLHDLEPRDQAEVLKKRLGERFQSVLENHLNTDKYALGHALLASMDPHEVVTTNYDTLMEDAFGNSRKPAVLPGGAVGPDGRWILKLHGTITDSSSVILTRSDYLGLPETSQALFGILQAMLMTKHMLFVGYSLTDDSFHKVVHEVRRARGARRTDKIGTVLTLFHDPLLEELWGDVLYIVPMMEQPATKQEESARTPSASRKLDMVLDSVALKAADISSFLLHSTYAGLVQSHEEKALKDAVRQAMAAAAAAGPLGEKLQAVLTAMFSGSAKASHAPTKGGPAVS